MNTLRLHPRCGPMLLMATATAMVMTVLPPSTAEAQGLQASRLHALAVDSFRQGRFSEAYGRFILLASAGHPASAQYALWMCEHGLALFGKDWDCTPHEIEDWARVAGVAMPSIGPRYYVAATGLRPGARR